jgi:hypothetical protein
MLPTATDPGLCATCGHAQRVVNDRNATFWLCRRSLADPGFPKYPRLPVLSCRGYEDILKQREAGESGGPNLQKGGMNG